MSDDVIGKATSVVGLVASAGGEIAWKMNERTRRAADRALAEGRAVEQVETKTGEELGIAAKAVGKNYGAIEDLKTTGEELKQDAGKEEALRLQLMAAQEKVEELEKKITDLEGCLAAAQADDGRRNVSPALVIQPDHRRLRHGCVPRKCALNLSRIDVFAT